MLPVEQKHQKALNKKVEYNSCEKYECTLDKRANTQFLKWVRRIDECTSDELANIQRHHQKNKEGRMGSRHHVNILSARECISLLPNPGTIRKV